VKKQKIFRGKPAPLGGLHHMQGKSQPETGSEPLFFENHQPVQKLSEGMRKNTGSQDRTKKDSTGEEN